LKPVRLCILELSVITSFIGYHWHCVSGYCACAVSRDLCVESKFYPHIWNPQPRFAYLLCNFGRSWMKIINAICENTARPCAKSRDLLKEPQMSYCSRSRRRRFTASDFKVEHIVSFTAVFSNICTAHAQDRLIMNFRCKFRHRRSIRRPRFPIRVQNFGDLATFSVDFCILYAECPPYFYFRFVWPTDRASILHALTPTTIIFTKFEVDMTIRCRVIAFLSADTSRDLVTLTFDLEQLSHMVGHVANLVTKFEDLTPIRS